MTSTEVEGREGEPGWARPVLRQVLVGVPDAVTHHKLWRPKGIIERAHQDGGQGINLLICEQYRILREVKVELRNVNLVVVRGNRTIIEGSVYQRIL